MQRIEIEWEDSGLVSADGWQTKEEVLRTAHIGNINTVGWLMHKDETSVYVALSHDRDHDHYYGLQVIAMSSVKKVTILRARRELDAEELKDWAATEQED